MRIIQLGHKAKPKVKLNEYSINNEKLDLYITTSEPEIIGILRLKTGEALLIEDKYKYKLGEEHINKFILFSLKSDGKIVFSNNKIVRVKAKHNIFSIIELSDSLLGRGSWLSIGKLGDILEVWPILIHNPYLYIFRYWSLYRSSVRIDLGSSYRYSINIKLKKLGDINISNAYIVYVYDDDPYIGYRGFKINLLNLLT